jgi:hypothetical protein
MTDGNCRAVLVFNENIQGCASLALHSVYLLSYTWGILRGHLVQTGAAVRESPASVGLLSFNKSAALSKPPLSQSDNVSNLAQRKKYPGGDTSIKC